MADSDLLVTISGAALSLLFYENVRSIGDQMGFLLGETLEFVVRTYTDSDNQVETIKIHNNVETVVTCPLPDLLYDSTGRINKKKLKDFVRDKNKQVIGWFRFRRNTSLVPTLRDKMLHKEFASYFSEGNGSKEEFFVTCLLSSSMSAENGTHKFRHVFLRHKKGTFEPVSLRINNLGNDSFRHDGSDYKPTPAKKSSDTPDMFAKLIESLNLDVTRTGVLESAITIQKAAERHLDELIPQVCESDLEVAELEKQVRELRTSISMRKLSKNFKINGSPDIGDRNFESEKGHTSEERRALEITGSPSRNESPDKMCENTCILKDHSTSSSQPSIPKIRNTAASIEKNVMRGQSNKMNAETVKSPNQEAFGSMVSEMKMDVIGSVPNKNRRSTGMVSEIVKESICKGETNELAVGRGRGRVIHDANPGLKRARRSAGPLATRSTAERNPCTELSERESSEANCVQNPTIQMSYTQATKKNLDNTRNMTHSPDNH